MLHLSERWKLSRSMWISAGWAEEKINDQGWSFLLWNDLRQLVKPGIFFFLLQTYPLSYVVAIFSRGELGLSPDHFQLWKLVGLQATFTRVVCAFPERCIKLSHQCFTNPPQVRPLGSDSLESHPSIPCSTEPWAALCPWGANGREEGCLSLHLP